MGKIAEANNEMMIITLARKTKNDQKQATKSSLVNYEGASLYETSSCSLLRE